MHCFDHLFLWILVSSRLSLSLNLNRLHLQWILSYKLLVLNTLLDERLLNFLIITLLSFLNILTPLWVRVLNIVILHTCRHLSNVHLSTLLWLKLCYLGTYSGITKFDFNEVRSHLLFFDKLFLFLKLLSFFYDLWDVFFLLDELWFHLLKLLIVLLDLSVMFLLHFLNLGNKPFMFLRMNLVSRWNDLLNLVHFLLWQFFLLFLE